MFYGPLTTVILLHPAVEESSQMAAKGFLVDDLGRGELAQHQQQH